MEGKGSKNIFGWLIFGLNLLFKIFILFMLSVISGVIFAYFFSLIVEFFGGCSGFACMGPMTAGFFIGMILFFIAVGLFRKKVLSFF